MPNYVDHLDLIDANDHVVVAMLQDRETLALATENLGKINALDTKIDGVDGRLDTKIDDVESALSLADTALGNRITNEIVYVPSSTLNLDNTGTNDCSAILSGISTNVGLKAGTYKIASNCTINAQVVFAQGAVLNVLDGVTLTINGQILAGRYQIFSGNGTVDGNSNPNSICYAEWFGAKTNDINVDNSAAINKALLSFNKVSLGKGVYYINNTISLKDNNELFGYGENYYTQNGNKGTVINSSATTAISISKSTYTSVATNITGCYIHDLTVIMPTNDTEYIGVECQYALYAKVYNVTAMGGKYGFTIKGCVHCSFDNCTASRDTSISSTLVEYVGFMCVTSDIDLAGDNASIYFNKCTASGALSLTQLNSYGFASRGRNSDLFYNQCETVGFTTSFELSIPRNNIIQQNNIHYINCIADAALFAAYHVVGYAEQSDVSIEFDNCWGAILTGSTGNCFHVDNVDGINISNSIAFANGGTSGFYFRNVRRFNIKGCTALQGTYGINMQYCSNADVELLTKGITYPIEALDTQLTMFKLHSMNGTSININTNVRTTSSTSSDMNDFVVGTNKVIAPFTI